MNIYQELWDLDLDHNGCSVSARGKDGNWIQPDADILLDEQNEATVGADQAPNPLFAQVNPEKISRPTYQALIALLNNYVVNVRISEDHLGDNEVEDREIEVFLDTILETDVMKKAQDYICNGLNFTDVADNFKSELKRIWFELYTNHFNRIPVPFASGFEHVFVGEGKRRGDGIGGYHSWTKYYLDEQSGRVDFQGFNYDGNFNAQRTDGSAIPIVATIKMMWNPLDMLGDPIGPLEKDMGGFWVGPSPELQIALGTVAFYESKANLFNQSSGNEKEVELMNGRFNLVMYRSTTVDQQRGDHIRSFFAKFKALKADPGPGKPVPGNGETVDDGIIRIVKALVNPEGSDMGREWVEIENTSCSIIDLAGWTIADKSDRREPILGQIEPGKVRRIEITRSRPDSAQLGNKGGLIKVYNSENKLIARVSYGKAESGVTLFFV
ncbi:MAG: lamin tail domain-containing protein [Cyanobacteria bacterium P01_F01_bin.150]